ncbi:hypothetical protein R3W88_033830 [Solanum pinnatisectum]|uniref:Uncharacterized protein n=1 Tax=Solanum pinnatisectum TaxID=50273 RepID=A0AAV9K0Y6_9SOLN|nr:hypothetical protein R3W88_033830 [Solanum pinnatisectum]
MGKIETTQGGNEGPKQGYGFIYYKTKHRLEDIQADMSQDLINQNLFDHEKVTILEIQKWSMVREKVLRQKSRACWIDSGNSNSKYFHAQLKIRTNHNSISSTYTENGVHIEELYAAIKDTLKDKSLGTDGYAIEFFYYTLGSGEG